MVWSKWTFTRRGSTFDRIQKKPECWIKRDDQDKTDNKVKRCRERDNKRDTEAKVNITTAELTAKCMCVSLSLSFVAAVVKNVLFECWEHTRALTGQVRDHQKLYSRNGQLPRYVLSSLNSNSWQNYVLHKSTFFIFVVICKQHAAALKVFLNMMISVSAVPLCPAEHFQLIVLVLYHCIWSVLISAPAGSWVHVFNPYTVWQAQHKKKNWLKLPKIINRL